MAVKGKEPAGLKRYRLSQKRKKGGRSNIMARSTKVAVRRAKKTTVPLSVALGFVPLVTRGINLWNTQGAQGLQHITSSVIPYDFVNRRVNFSNLGTGLYPIIAGLAVHKIVGGYLGVNRALGRAGIPFVRL